MIKFIKNLGLAVNSLLLLAWTKVLAQDGGILDRVNRANNEAGLATTEASPQRIIINFINYALTLVGLFFLISIIYAGWQWMSSGGEEDKIEDAKKRLKNSIIGVTIIAASMVIVVYVDNIAQRSTNSGGYYDFNAGGNPSGKCNRNVDCLGDFGSGWLCQEGWCSFNQECDNTEQCQEWYGNSYECKSGPIKNECARN
ncbi:MAG: pilin [Candidatus Komeilibacteria bacterium]|nr:pilin [Candidatus Komeilibacteria bacterium]